MTARLRSLVIGTVAVGAAVGLVCVGGISRVLAESTTLDGVTASARVEASPYSFWFGQVNRDGICRMVSGCVSATGADPNWVFNVQVEVPGTGVQTVPVSVKVLDQVTTQKAAFQLSYDSPIGSLNGTVNLDLKASGDATVVTITLNGMQATGLAVSAIPQFQAGLQPYLQSQMDVLGRERDNAGTKVTLKVKPGKKAVATVRVTATSLTRMAPKARGQLRVLVGNRVVCIGKVKASKGSCRFTPPKKGAEIRAVVTGRLSNGYPVWNSASRRYGR